MINKNRVIAAEEKSEGEGAIVNRLFPTAERDHLDPFVLLDEFQVEPPNSFAEHGHRGFEAVSYILEGGLKHSDNLDNEAVADEGELQYFRAGKGIRHSEEPVGEGLSRGIQLWINLPRELKEASPEYRLITSGNIPLQEKPGLRIRTILGPGAPLEVSADVIMQDVELSREETFNLQLSDRHQGLIFVISGELQGQERVARHQGYLLAPAAECELKSAAESSRFIVLIGEPLKQEIKIEGGAVL